MKKIVRPEFVLMRERDIAQMFQPMVKMKRIDADLSVKSEMTRSNKNWNVLQTGRDTSSAKSKQLTNLGSNIVKRGTVGKNSCGPQRKLFLGGHTTAPSAQTGVQDNILSGTPGPTSVYDYPDCISSAEEAAETELVRSEANIGLASRKKCKKRKLGNSHRTKIPSLYGQNQDYPKSQIQEDPKRKCTIDVSLEDSDREVITKTPKVILHRIKIPESKPREDYHSGTRISREGYHSGTRIPREGCHSGTRIPREGYYSGISKRQEDNSSGRSTPSLPSLDEEEEGEVPMHLLRDSSTPEESIGQDMWAKGNSEESGHGQYVDFKNISAKEQVQKTVQSKKGASVISLEDDDAAPALEASMFPGDDTMSEQANPSPALSWSDSSPMTELYSEMEENSPQIAPSGISIDENDFEPSPESTVLIEDRECSQDSTHDESEETPSTVERQFEENKDVSQNHLETDRGALTAFENDDEEKPEHGEQTSLHSDNKHIEMDRIQSGNSELDAIYIDLAAPIEDEPESAEPGTELPEDPQILYPDLPYDTPYINPPIDPEILDDIKSVWVYQHKTGGLFTYKRGRTKPSVNAIRSMFRKAYEPVVSVPRAKTMQVTSAANPLPKLIRLQDQDTARRRQRRSDIGKVEIRLPCLYGLAAKMPKLMLNPKWSFKKDVRLEALNLCDEPVTKTNVIPTEGDQPVTDIPTEGDLPVTDIPTYGDQPVDSIPSGEEDEVDDDDGDTIFKKLEMLLSDDDSEDLIEMYREEGDAVSRDRRTNIEVDIEPGALSQTTDPITLAVATPTEANDEEKADYCPTGLHEPYSPFYKDVQGDLETPPASPLTPLGGDTADDVEHDAKEKRQKPRRIAISSHHTEKRLMLHAADGYLVSEVDGTRNQTSSRVLDDSDQGTPDIIQNSPIPTDGPKPRTRKRPKPRPRRRPKPRPRQGERKQPTRKVQTALYADNEPIPHWALSQTASSASPGRAAPERTRKKRSPKGTKTGNKEDSSTPKGKPTKRLLESLESYWQYLSKVDEEATSNCSPPVVTPPGEHHEGSPVVPETPAMAPQPKKRRRRKTTPKRCIRIPLTEAQDSTWDPLAWYYEGNLTPEDDPTEPDYPIPPWLSDLEHGLEHDLKRAISAKEEFEKQGAALSAGLEQESALTGLLELARVAEAEHVRITKEDEHKMIFKDLLEKEKTTEVNGKEGSSSPISVNTSDQNTYIKPTTFSNDEKDTLISDFIEKNRAAWRRGPKTKSAVAQNQPPEIQEQNRLNQPPGGVSHQTEAVAKQQPQLDAPQQPHLVAQQQQGETPLQTGETKHSRGPQITQPKFGDTQLPPRVPRKQPLEAQPHFGVAEQPQGRPQTPGRPQQQGEVAKETNEVVQQQPFMQPHVVFIPMAPMGHSFMQPNGQVVFTRPGGPLPYGIQYAQHQVMLPPFAPPVSMNFPHLPGTTSHQSSGSLGVPNQPGIAAHSATGPVGVQNQAGIVSNLSPVNSSPLSASSASRPLPLAALTPSGTPFVPALVQLKEGMKRMSSATTAATVTCNELSKDQAATALKSNSESNPAIPTPPVKAAGGSIAQRTSSNGGDEGKITHTPTAKGLEREPAPHAHNRKSSIKVMMDNPILAHSIAANYSMFPQLKCSMEPSAVAPAEGLDVGKTKMGNIAETSKTLGIQSPTLTSLMSSMMKLPVPIMTSRVSTTSTMSTTTTTTAEGGETEVLGSKTDKGPPTARRARKTAPRRKPPKGKSQSVPSQVGDISPVQPPFDLSNMKAQTCQTCGSFSLLMCSGCNRAAYCSVHCQAMSWASHIKVCNFLSLTSGGRERKEKATDIQ